MNELQFILYNTPEGNQSSKHLNHIFEEGELNADVVVSKMGIVVNRG